MSNRNTVPGSSYLYHGKIMGKSGRFGKYGETKRIGRLRKASITSNIARYPKNKVIWKPEFHINKGLGQKRILIRQAQPEDVDYIQRLSLKVFQRYGPYTDTLAQWFGSNLTETILAVTGKKSVGFAMLGGPIETLFFRSQYELLAIAVNPDIYRLGIGSRLMGEIERRAKALHAQNLILHTATENIPGRLLFEKCGFTLFKIKRNFYPRGQDAFMMHKTLLN